MWFVCGNFDVFPKLILKYILEDISAINKWGWDYYFWYMIFLQYSHFLFFIGDITQYFNGENIPSLANNLKFIKI